MYVSVPMSLTVESGSPALQCPSGGLHQWLHHPGAGGLLCRVHLHADIHDPRDHFHVPACPGPLWAARWSSTGDLCCHCRCFLLLFPVQACRETTGLLVVARQAHVLPKAGNGRTCIVSWHAVMMMLKHGMMPYSQFTANVEQLLRWFDVLIGVFSRFMFILCQCWIYNVNAHNWKE